MYKKIIILIIVCTSCVSVGRAQFYYQGRGAASIKWMQLKTDKYKLLYPDYFAPTAFRMANFMDTVQPFLNYGFPERWRRTPIILNTQNQLSNGLVVWAPRREELVTTAPIDNTAVPWLKQLAIHEGRHVAQMSVMKTGLTKVLTWVLGEAGIGVGLLVVSSWVLEGDATNAETQLSEYGRGLQPDFTIEYRALLADPKVTKFRTTDQWVCESYKKHVPDEYKFGYQMVTAAQTYYSPTIWGEILDYSAKWPIFILPERIYLHRHYQTSNKILTRRTFRELDSLWRPLAVIPNDFRTITPNGRSYTTYQYPLRTGNDIITLKKDFDTPQRFVTINAQGMQKNIYHTGTVTSRPILRDSVMYWTELKPHPIYEQKNFSIIRSYNLGNKKREKYHNWENNYLVTSLGERGFATISNDSLANSYIKFFDPNFVQQYTYHFDVPTTLHGLAWDEPSGVLAFLAVDERGMWLGGLRDGAVEVLKAPSMVTLKDLTARDGKLYFGSIISGKDEINVLEITTTEEFRLTNSRFGSGSPSVSDSSMVFTTYNSNGWHVATAGVDTVGRSRVEWSRLPNNIVNPKRYKWQVPNADTISLTDTTMTDAKSKRYRKFGRQFNFHSWAPVAVNLPALLNERDIRLGFGATGFFQSTLGDMNGSLALGAMGGEFWGVGSFTYTGLPVQLGVSAEYGGGNRMIYGSPPSGYDIDWEPYFSVSGTVSLPLNLSSGACSQLLQPSFSVTHYNALFYDAQTASMNHGYQKWGASLWWSSTKRSSYRSITPRLGYALRADVNGAFGQRFGTQLSLWARGYLPGFLPNHSMTLRAGYQRQTRAEYNFAGKVLTPRGVVDPYLAKNYGGVAFDYSFPIFYPDWGWDGVVYFRRLWANVFADYSAGEYFTNSSVTMPLEHYSYGIDVGIDFNLFRTFEQGIVFTFAMPDNGGLWFSVGYRFNFM